MTTTWENKTTDEIIAACARAGKTQQVLLMLSLRDYEKTTERNIDGTSVHLERKTALKELVELSERLT